MASWNYWTFSASVAGVVCDACGLVHHPTASPINVIYEQQKELFIFVRIISELSFERLQNITTYFHREHWVRTFEFIDLCDFLAAPLTAN